MSGIVRSVKKVFKKVVKTVKKVVKKVVKVVKKVLPIVLAAAAIYFTAGMAVGTFGGASGQAWLSSMPGWSASGAGWSGMFTRAANTLGADFAGQMMASSAAAGGTTALTAAQAAAGINSGVTSTFGGNVLGAGGEVLGSSNVLTGTGGAFGEGAATWTGGTQGITAQGQGWLGAQPGSAAAEVGANKVFVTEYDKAIANGANPAQAQEIGNQYAVEHQTAQAGQVAQPAAQQSGFQQAAYTQPTAGTSQVAGQSNLTFTDPNTGLSQTYNNLSPAQVQEMGATLQQQKVPYSIANAGADAGAKTGFWNTVTPGQAQLIGGGVQGVGKVVGSVLEGKGEEELADKEAAREEERRAEMGGYRRPGSTLQVTAQTPTGSPTGYTGGGYLGSYNLTPLVTRPVTVKA